MNGPHPIHDDLVKWFEKLDERSSNDLYYEWKKLLAAVKLVELHLRKELAEHDDVQE